MDRSPAEVVATLSEEGQYLASTRTLYRLLEANQLVRERRAQRVHPAYAAPQLLATAPNQVWSWDITKLMTPQKFHYLFLYVIMDIFSRYVVGWLTAERENAALAKNLIEETCLRQNITPKLLSLHSDRGSPMRSLTLAQLLARLDVTASFSRPQVSNDNPFSESLFKTVKYHPGMPARFTGLPDANTHVGPFFAWYNHKHHHQGIAHLTPWQVHHGHAQALLQRRHQTMMDAYQRHPERFVRGAPKPDTLPPAVYINPPDPLVLPPHPPQLKT